MAPKPETPLERAEQHLRAALTELRSSAKALKGREQADAQLLAEEILDVLIRVHGLAVDPGSG